MTDKEILQKAIQRALKNGYLIDKKLYWWREDFTIENYKRLDIIFSHDFAKAFWGFEEIDDSEGEFGTITAWEHHLQQMILEKEPLKYLEKFL